VYRPSVLVVAAFVDAHHVLALHRVRALERLGCEVEEFDLQWRPALLQRFSGGDIHSRLERTLREIQPELVLVLGGT
jgi:hypothetical protein